MREQIQAHLDNIFPSGTSLNKARILSILKVELANEGYSFVAKEVIEAKYRKELVFSFTADLSISDTLIFICDNSRSLGDMTNELESTKPFIYQSILIVNVSSVSISVHEV